MPSFRQAATNTATPSFTYNGSLTNQSSQNACVDLFFLVGASRGKDISKQFKAAFGENPEVATRILLWARDVRKGAGERQTFRDLLKTLEKLDEDMLMRVLEFVPVYGRWDDLFIFEQGSKARGRVFQMIKESIKRQGVFFNNDLVFEGPTEYDGLLWKWLPRQGKFASHLRNYLGMSPKQYRHMVVSHTKVVEQQMCAKEWKEINFKAVPSVASQRYSKAFGRHAPEEYTAFKTKAVKGEVKVNASAIFPHDVLKEVIAEVTEYCRTGNYDKDLVVAQWNNLPNLLGDNSILPMIDVSGSMTMFNYYGGSKGKGNVTPIQIAMSLGLYVADKQKGKFKDMVLTFSTKPTLIDLKGKDIFRKVQETVRMNWDGSTNIEAAFEQILRVAVQNNVPEEEMPKTLLVLSDMEFNSCVHSRSTSYANARSQYRNAGYKLPKIVFWNLNGREGNNPVTFREDGTALVSGYSQNVLKSVVKGELERFTPENVMLDTVMDERYNIWN